jgi:hypothetical protein
LIASSYAKTKPILVANHAPQGEGEEEDVDEETHAADHSASVERFLQKDSGGLWVLKPLPDLGTVRNTDLGKALHVYVTQQWSMAISRLFLGF